MEVDLEVSLLTVPLAWWLCLKQEVNFSVVQMRSLPKTRKKLAAFHRADVLVHEKSELGSAWSEHKRCLK